MIGQNDSGESNEDAGGCLAKDVHDEIRTQKVDVGGKENPTSDLMRPQTEEPEAYDG